MKKKLNPFKSLEQKVFEAQNFRDEETIYDDNPYGDIPQTDNEYEQKSLNKPIIKNEE
jgi:hypothetical protein